MKKVFGIIILILLIFIILMYVSLNSKPKKIETSKLVNIENVNSINFHDHDSILITATTQYQSNELKRVMQGEHYRKAWSAPIKVPIVFLDTLYGGMTMLKEGGGHQTKSLKMQAPNGVLYSLRSINKTPGPLVPKIAKTLGLDNIIIDGISAQHPYAAVVVAQLAKNAKVLITFPKIVFVPKQSTLGDFNANYGNRLYLLEYETESKVNWTTLPNVTEIVETDDLQKLKLELGAQLTIDQKALVRARLFDLLIGDWDRHAKQWGWVLQFENGNYKAIPLPADRDNAFFNLGGVIPNMIANKNIKPEMRPFQKEIDYLPGLVEDFDVYFLQKVPESVFVEEAKQLQAALTDKVIEDALHLWPQNLYELDGVAIAEKIRSRRNDLINYAKGFKNILDQKPLLTEPLKGSEDLKLSNDLLACFGCHEN
ncbi:MAG: hypothetical protein ABIO60_00105 [Aquaticitalea sp.]